MTKLQVALDLLDLSKALEIIKEVYEYVDIIEVGTPLLKKFGVHGVSSIIKPFSNKEILVDTKTMDAIELEATTAKLIGDWFTVLALAPKGVIRKIPLIKVRYKIKIAVDTIGVNNLKEKINEILKYKPDLFVIHKGVDEEKFSPDLLGDLEDLNIKVAVAGGIDKDLIKDLRPYKDMIDVVIVGRYITQSKNPGERAKELKKEIRKWLG